MKRTFTSTSSTHRATSAALFTAFLRSMYSPKARYMAPVSRYMAFSDLARALAMVDLPAPAGPSMAMEKGFLGIMVLPSSCRVGIGEGIGNRD